MNLVWFGVPPSGGSNGLDRLKPGLRAARGFMGVLFAPIRVIRLIRGSRRTNPLAGQEGFALPQPRELATALDVVRDSDLSGRIGGGARTDRSGKAEALSIWLQSAIAGTRAALR